MEWVRIGDPGGHPDGVLVQHLLMCTKSLPITTEAGHPLFADSLELTDDLRKARMIGRPKEGLREIHADLSAARVVSYDLTRQWLGEDD